MVNSSSLEMTTKQNFDPFVAVFFLFFFKETGWVIAVPLSTVAFVVFVQKNFPYQP